MGSHDLGRVVLSVQIRLAPLEDFMCDDHGHGLVKKIFAKVGTLPAKTYTHVSRRLTPGRRVIV